MSIKTKEQEIDGRKITVSQFPGRRGTKYLTKLLRLAGPSIGSLLGNVKLTKGSASILDSQISAGSLDGAVRALVSQLDEDETLSFVMKLLESTRINGKEIDDAIFDSEFAGEYALLFKILGFVLKVNYNRFFGPGGIGALEERIRQLMPEESSTDSTPQS